MLNKSEFYQLFPRFNYEGIIEPFMHKGEWAVHEVLPILLEYIGTAEVMIATFSISEDSLRPLFFLVDAGKISKLTMLLDTTVKRHKLDMLLFASNITQNIRIESNHAKVLLIKNDKYKFGIVGSANLNQPQRVEAGFYFTAGSHFDFFENQFYNYFDTAIPYDLD